MMSVAALVACQVAPLWAQAFTWNLDRGEFQLSNSLDIEDIPNEAEAHLANVEKLLSFQKWDEAVETLRKVADDFGDYVIQVGESDSEASDETRYLNVRRYCQIRLATLPKEALSLYRHRVDGDARSWYEQGVADRDSSSLHRIVDNMFCSSVGDDALLWLGDEALEQGKYNIARWYWERISPKLRNTDGFSCWHSKHLLEQKAVDWLVYPDDSDIELASVQARLVLASIMQGAMERARWELQKFREGDLTDSEGLLAGVDGNYVETLEALIKQQSSWPDNSIYGDWRTFAGNDARSRVLDSSFEIPPVANWKIKYEDIMDLGLQKAPLPPAQRVPPPYGHREKKLAFYPLVVGKLVLLNNSEQVFAFDAQTGEAAFNRPKGQIFPGPDDGQVRNASAAKRSPFSQPRYTMTAYKDLLFVRIGTQVTARPPGSLTGRAGNRLLCLDLKREGIVKWRYPPIELNDQHEAEFDRNRWAFEGPPLTDGDGVYVAMRRSQSRAESYVACFDFHSGQLRWRRKICSADTPTRGQETEITHNLVTLADGVVYLNTNLGAIGAVRASDGQILWIHQYPRASGRLSEAPLHFYRDLNPCIYHQGLIITAPSDSNAIIALDAGTGRRVWRRLMEIHPMHMLGVSKGNLIATGKSIWWFDVADAGRAIEEWPPAQDNNTLRGFGRGLLAGDDVYWPTREKVYVFDQGVDLKQGIGPLEKPPIQLLRPDLPPDQQTAGGNLVVGNGMLLVAGETELSAFPLREP